MSPLAKSRIWSAWPVTDCGGARVAECVVAGRAVQRIRTEPAGQRVLPPPPQMSSLPAAGEAVVAVAAEDLEEPVGLGTAVERQDLGGRQRVGVDDQLLAGGDVAVIHRQIIAEPAAATAEAGVGAVSSTIISMPLIWSAPKVIALAPA